MPKPEPHRRRIALAAGAAAVVVALAQLARPTTTGPTVTVPGSPAPSAQWAGGEPVWVIADEGEAPTVFAARNPHPWFGLDELVGWCASPRHFEAYWDGSRFSSDGSHEHGPSPRHLAVYEVRRTRDGQARLERLVERDRAVADSLSTGGRVVRVVDVPLAEEPGGSCEAEGDALRFHGTDGSGRRLYEGHLVLPRNGTAQLCRRLLRIEPPACGDDALAVPEAGWGGGTHTPVLHGRLLAREGRRGLVDVILLPGGDVTWHLPRPRT